MVLLFADVIEGSECTGQDGAVKLCTVVISWLFIHIKAGGQYVLNISVVKVPLLQRSAEPWRGKIVQCLCNVPK